MPEGPEVRTVTLVLNKALSGKTLFSLEWSPDSKYNRLYNDYSILKQYLPMTIKGVTCKGKRIFFVLTRTYIGIDNQCHTVTFYIYSHLKMTGRWVWQSSKHANFWMNIGHTESLTDNIDLNFIEKQIYFDDYRKMGSLEILLTEDLYQTKWSELGPDLLTEDVNLDVWTTAITNKRRQNMQICKFLLEQKYFCGIGNYLKAEILYRSHVRPDRILSSLESHEIETLLKVSIDTIREAFSYKGLTISDYWDPDGNKGTFQCLVYNQDCDPNGYTVIKSKFKDNRTTHWVREVQT